jgi:hypothetical protein
MGRTKLIGIFALVCCSPWREQQTEVSKLRAENDSLALTAERADGVRLDGLQIPPARRSVDEALKRRAWPCRRGNGLHLRRRQYQ